MVKGHRIERAVKVSTFLEMMKDYSKNQINCTHHTFFRLSEKQRELFKCDSIRDILLGEEPVLVGIQYNGCHTAFYKYENKRFIRVIIELTLDKIDVVTFYVVEENQLPTLK